MVRTAVDSACSLRRLSRHSEVISRAASVRVNVLDQASNRPAELVSCATSADSATEATMSETGHATVSDGGLDKLLGLAELHTESLQDPESRVNNFLLMIVDFRICFFVLYPTQKVSASSQVRSGQRIACPRTSQG